MASEHLIHALLIWATAAALAGVNGLLVYWLIVFSDRVRRARCFVSAYSARVCERGTCGCVTDHGHDDG